MIPLISATSVRGYFSLPFESGPNLEVVFDSFLSHLPYNLSADQSCWLYHEVHLESDHLTLDLHLDHIILFQATIMSHLGHCNCLLESPHFYPCSGNFYNIILWPPLASHSFRVKANPLSRLKIPYIVWPPCSSLISCSMVFLSRFPLWPWGFLINNWELCSYVPPSWNSLLPETPSLSVCKC